MSSTVLWAFGKLLPHHPTACRPFVGQIRAFALPFIAPTTSIISNDGRSPCSQITVQRARHVFVLLGGCAAKNNQGQEWAQSLSLVIDTSHRTADSVVRALTEDWEPIEQRRLHSGKGNVPSTGTPRLPDDESGLPGWTGLSAGLERLNGLILTVQAHLQYGTAAAVTIPVDRIVNLVDRILSALPPSPEALEDTGKGTRTNPEIDRDERETLWTGLPQLHVSAMQILEHLILRLGDGPMPLDYRLLDYVLWVFEHEHSHTRIREVVYTVVTLLLPRCKSGVPQIVASSLERCLRICCKDLLQIQRGSLSPTFDSSTSKPGVVEGSSSADAYSKTADSSLASSTGPSELQKLAEHMLSTALIHLPSSFLRSSLRTKIDQTAILAQSNQMLRSSILNAANHTGHQQQSSLMPLLARFSPQDQGTESLLRPRLPPVQHHRDDESIDLAQGVEDEEVVYQERPRPSLPVPGPLEDNSVSKATESEKQDQVEASSQNHRSEDVPNSVADLQPQINSMIPVKRPLDRDQENPEANVRSESADSLAPVAEPAHKRAREGNGDIYVRPATEDDLPPRVIDDPRKDHETHPANPPASFEPLTTLRAMREDVEDDSSDDSTIPPMDLTLATDDEDEDEDENEDENGENDIYDDE
ncbi:MAG: hypothetical protein Q9169_003413 [Polycauliona sp. 2 TL-2023]